MINRRCTFVILAALIAFAGAQCAWAQTNWTGSISTDWSDAGNWDNGVPDSSNDAIINTLNLVNVGTTDVPAYNQPTLAAATATPNIYVQSGTSLNLADGAALTTATTLSMAEFEGSAGGSLFYTGTAGLTIDSNVQWLNATIMATSSGAFTLTGAVSGSTFRSGNAGASPHTVNYTGTLTISGNTSFDEAYWNDDSGAELSITHITGTALVGMGVEGLYVGGIVQVAEDGKLNCDGGNRADSWNHGGYELSDNGQFNVYCSTLTPSSASSWNGGLYVGSWNGFQGRAHLTATGHSQVNVQTLMQLNAWGTNASCTLSGTAALNVGWQLWVGAGGGLAHMSMSDNSTADVGELLVGTGNTDSYLNLSGSSSLVTTAGTVIFTDNSTNSNGNITIGSSDGANSGAINISDSASLAVAAGAITTINPNSSINVTTDGSVDLKNLAGVGTLSVDNGAAVSLDSINGDTIMLGTGSVGLAEIAAAPQGASLNSVPEPSTIVMLTMAAMGLILAAWRRK